jgi:hypothetical protein
VHQEETELRISKQGDHQAHQAGTHPRVDARGQKMNLDPPMFRTINGALAFAFNFKHGQLKPSALATMMASSKTSARGLGGLDGAAQAGLIRSDVAALDPKIRGHILVARFCVRALPCSCRRDCCSGWRSNAEWLLAIADIANVVRQAALAGTVVNFTLRYAIVRRYFGVKQSLADAARASGVERHTASAHANKVIAYLKQEERQARYAIEARLKEANVVE